MERNKLKTSTRSSKKTRKLRNSSRVIRPTQAYYIPPARRSVTETIRCLYEIKEENLIENIIYNRELKEDNKNIFDAINTLLEKKNEEVNILNSQLKNENKKCPPVSENCNYIYNSPEKFEIKITKSGGLRRPKMLESQQYADRKNLSHCENSLDSDGDSQRKSMKDNTMYSSVKVVENNRNYCTDHHQNTECEDLVHVIELYDFSPCFRTMDLMRLYFSACKKGMFVKWCDDTHALLVFPHSSYALRALDINHGDIIKSRPLSQGSDIAISIANKSNLKFVVKRPPTSMRTARRMIINHLETNKKFNLPV